MHTNPAFRGAERTQNLAFVKSRGFGVLSVNGPQGPLMAHIPISTSILQNNQMRTEAQRVMHKHV